MTSLLTRNLAASKCFKAKLRDKQPATLIHSNHPAPSLVERLAEYGFDAVLIDAEHGSVGRERVEEMSRAAALAGTAAIIRPEGSVPHLITGYLGCGVDGFMLPLIKTPAQAKELVDCFRYSAPVDHDARVMILMIERIEAVECLPALLDIEGIDAFMVAPDDLAVSLGEPVGKGSPTQRVLDTINRAITTIVAARRTCGMCVRVDTIEDYRAKGVTLFYDHADRMLARGSQAFLSKLR